MCTKNVLLKVFRCDKFNKIYINGLKIDEILTYVSMYGGHGIPPRFPSIPHRFRATDAQTAMWPFGPVF